MKLKYVLFTIASAVAFVIVLSVAMFGTSADDSNVCYVGAKWSGYNTIDDYHDGQPGKVYALVDVKMKNNASKSVSTNPNYWHFVADGIEYSFDLATYSEHVNHDSVDVLPGGEIETQFVFLVDADASRGRVYYVGPNSQWVEYVAYDEITI